MSVQSEITRISGNIGDAYTAVENKGGTLPASLNSGNLPAAIESIPVGHASSKETIGVDSSGNLVAECSFNWSFVIGISNSMVTFWYDKTRTSKRNCLALSTGAVMYDRTDIFAARDKGITVTLGRSYYGREFDITFYS